MLDTIILSLPREQYRIFEPQRFSPEANLLLHSGYYMLKCVNNPTKLDYKNGIVKPRLTLTKRPTKNGDTISLRVEFSAPKLIFGNNLDELRESDFDNVNKTLQKRLYEMGVEVNLETLKNAFVTVFHPSKNIILENGYSASFVIKELGKINLSKKLDMDKVGFRNNGQSLQYYTNSHSFVIYDKVADLNKKPKRAIDKDQTLIQIALLEKVKRMNIPRFEVRFSKNVKMKTTLKTLGFKERPTFSDLFNVKMCQAVIKDYWFKIMDSNGYLFDTVDEPQKVLNRFLKNKIITPKSAIFLTGLYLLAKDENGIGSLRKIIEGIGSERSWLRISNQLNGINKLNIFQAANWSNDISESITRFEPIRMTTTAKMLDLACKE